MRGSILVALATGSFCCCQPVTASYSLLLISWPNYTGVIQTTFMVSVMVDFLLSTPFHADTCLSTAPLSLMYLILTSESIQLPFLQVSCICGLIPLNCQNPWLCPDFPTHNIFLTTLPTRLPHPQWLRFLILILTPFLRTELSPSHPYVIHFPHSN